MPAKRKVESRESVPIFVVCGQEGFLKRQAIVEIIEQVLGDADRSLALSEYDGSTAAVVLADVLDELRTLPFLTEKRLLILRDADTFITRYREDLEAYVEDPCTSGVLLIECRSFPATTRLYKKVRAVGEVIKCDQIPARQIPTWLVTRCRDAYAVKLDSRSAAMLCDVIGDDLGQLDGELQKLSVYVGDRGRISPQDVESLACHCREEQVWGILSAIAAGDQSRAMALWEEVWQTDRAASARAIGGIAFTVRRLLNAKRAQATGASMRELARMLWSDERRARTELSAFTINQLEEMLCRLLGADVAGKTGLASTRSSIEAFIVEMCNSRQRRATG